VAWTEFGGVIHCMSVKDRANFRTAANCYSLFNDGPNEYASRIDPLFELYVPSLTRFYHLTTLPELQREDLAEASNRIVCAMIEPKTLIDEAAGP
jgi:hypothetical protein